MSREEQSTSDKQFYQVFDGAFRTRVREDYPEAIRRINKNNVEVFEREVRALFGVIEDVAIEKTDFGDQIKITLDENEEKKHPVLSFGVESKNGRDVLRKLPSVDFTKEVRIMPYRFTPEDSPEEKSGISFTQQDSDGKFTVKIENFFYDAEKKSYKHEFPTIDWDNATESQQKIYKVQRDDFLVQYLKENVIPKFNSTVNTEVKPTEYPAEEVRPEDIPF